MNKKEKDFVDLFDARYRSDIEEMASEDFEMLVQCMSQLVDNKANFSMTDLKKAFRISRLLYRAVAQ